MEDFEELRRLLLSREQEEIRELRARLEDKEKRVRDVAAILPHATRLSLEKSGELARALEPSIENALRHTVGKRPQIFVEALHPIIGPIVRRSIAESLRGLLQSLNQTLENTFSWQGLRWRFEAIRTGRSFAEVVLLRSMVYRVEQLFLIHRETSLSLLHATADSAVSKDSDMVAGMLSAIQDFARDSFEAGADALLEQFRVGELEVWIASGRHAYLAAVVRGTPPRELRTLLEEAIETVHILKGPELASFEGDSAVFEPLRPELEACLQAQYHPTGTGQGSQIKAWLALSGAVAVVLVAAFLAWRSERRWNDFVRRLNAEPGLAVTSAQNGWFTNPRLNGLRDPVAVDPVPLAVAAGINPAAVKFQWKEYLALDPASVRRRFEQRFSMPAQVRLEVRNGTAEITGAAPYEWIERVRREALHLPGINNVVERELKTTYDPVQVLARFQNAFPPPAGVGAGMEEGTLQLTGMAPYEWVARVREEATRIPGITAISEKDLRIQFDPALVLERFTSRFGLPETVKASVEEGTLLLSGEASHAWLARVRPAATQIPGITALREVELSDLDEQIFRQARSVIESALIYFLPNKESFATEGFAALSRLPDEIRRLQGAAKRIGTGFTIEIRGSADAVGSDAKNIELSQRRAGAVFDFLVSCGLEAAMFKPLGLGSGSGGTGGGGAEDASRGAAESLPGGTALPGRKPAAEQANRRVAFRVVIPSSSPPP
ncbi:MAG: OmpA family protein [Verrucomicrobiota bacterium]